MGKIFQQKKIALLKALLTLLFMLTQFPLRAETAGYNENVPYELAPRSILGFAKHLAGEGDFYRALSELDRLNGYYPNFLPEQRYIISKSFFLFSGGRYEDVQKTWALPTGCRSAERAQDVQKTRSGFPGTPGLWVFAADTYLASADYSKMDTLLRGVDTDDVLYKNILLKRRILASVVLEDRNALAVLEQLYSGEYSAYRELAAASSAMLAEKKSPALAALCGIFPGAGYAYAGNFYTGVVAFIVAAVSGALSYAAYANNSKLTAFFIGTIGTFFYGGSILGGYLSAKKFNRSLTEETAYGMARGMSFTEDYENIYNRDGIGGMK
ncbi:MAG: hypothetical protein LBT84_03295 [Spirochaetia bacterium]|jgi:hypothetical protein|nr:hypothetical protein [Spirochaetia bacterium]